MNKIFKRPLGKFLLWAALILVGVGLVTASTVSLAKYVSSKETDGTAGVARVGIETFDLKKYGKTVAGIDYAKIVPGADIPGPHVSLKLNSEVSYTLYLKVSTSLKTDEKGNVSTGTITYTLADAWVLDPLQSTTDVFVYKYDLGGQNFVFKPAMLHDYTKTESDDNTIIILKNDLIYVSDQFKPSESKKPNEPEFKLTFEVYIRQVLS